MEAKNPTSDPVELPFPPEEMRHLVGPTELNWFDNPSGDLTFPMVPAEAYDSVLDFGCGCGRHARQFIQQRQRPRAYLGIDVHRGMVQWCQRNLAPRAPGFRFEHHDVWSLAFNPQGSRTPRPFPAADRSISLVHAWSVFTHVVEADASYYLGEVARVLKEDGYFHCTWFLFDKAGFPMMQEFQHALYINDVDPSNAVIYDRRWFLETLGRLGLKVVQVAPPEVRGYHWVVLITHRSHPRPEVELPEDRAEAGIARAPLMPPQPEKIGA